MKRPAIVAVGLAMVAGVFAMACGGDGEPGAASAPADGAVPQSTGKIAFTSDRDGNDEIYVMNADGSDVTNLTDNPASDLFPPGHPTGAA